MLVCELETEDATARLGVALGGVLQAAGGGFVRLDGPLGAGKTTLARGILRGLGHGGAVTSPTYAIVHRYPSIAASHVDAYRVESDAELEQVGILDELGAGTWIVEWAARFPGAWPEDSLGVELDGTGTSRRARIWAGGTDSDALLVGLRAVLGVP